MQSVRQQGTRAEMSLRSALHRRGLRYCVQRNVLADVRRMVDIVFPRARVAIFVDGCFWHSCPVHRTWPKQNDEYWRTKIERNVERDKDTDRRLLQAGWHVLRFWAHEDPTSAATQIAATVKRRRHRHAG